MALKFNGVDGGDGGVRWYNPATGDVVHKELSAYELDHSCSELEFSRKVVKTKPRDMIPHPDHVPDPDNKDAFWINGFCSDKDLRITFATGMKDKIVISKNLVDFLFCSTNQPFTSCYRLDNGTEKKLEMYNKTPGYFIAYITQEDATYTFEDTEYTHPKMQARCWLFRSEDGQHYIVGRPYGKTGYELRETLRQWLPNGTEIGWSLGDKQKGIIGYQYDNFDGEGVAIHDKYDKTFNKDCLYKDEFKITYIEKSK